MAGCAIRNAPEDATEQQIGINVFGRSPGYNSSEDSIVRTHARLLRQKLAAYFEHPDVTEEMVVEIPKGHYFPIFAPRLAAQSETGSPLPAKPTAIPAPPVVDATPAPRHEVRWIVGGMMLLLVCLLGVAVWHPWTKRVLVQSPVEVFWHAFFIGAPPLVIYSNALFVG
ncbi:MAG: hypothetical protein ABI072_08395, partial [Edaphobacter sp.]